jgi:hypothetical protein
VFQHVPLTLPFLDEFRVIVNEGQEELQNLVGPFTQQRAYLAQAEGEVKNEGWKKKNREAEKDAADQDESSSGSSGSGSGSASSNDEGEGERLGSRTMGDEVGWNTQFN